MKYTRSVPMIDLDVLDAIRAEDLAAAFVCLFLLRSLNDC